MKASVNWIRSLVPGLTASAHDIAERLTRAGLEVEAIQRFGEASEQVIVVAVQAIAPHPSRSNLRLVTVDTGAESMTVVCGAPNVPPPGGLVCLARVGLHLPAINVTLEPRAIGGVVSHGMLCSEVELGIGTDSSGILILPEGTAPVGTPLAKAVPAMSDWVLEIGVTPNRPDALGHVGIARDVAALFGLPFAPPPPDAPTRIAQGKIDDFIAIEVRDLERCPHYGALMVTDVKIEPSPMWLRYRLASLGIRSISSVVDITNLLMLEFGHPLHAFDMDLLRGNKIIVRRATKGEKMRTLDGVDRVLEEDDLLICDAEGPVALAGVMGGENTEIRATTRRVLFECAWFEPRGVRRTARRHGMHTESSHRFERGVDPGGIDDVMAQAGALATRLASGAAIPGSIHVRGTLASTPPIKLRQSRIRRLLGTDVPMVEAKAILERLGFACTDLHDEHDRLVVVTVPTHRPDVTMEADLVEEVARIRGLDAIPTELPPIRPQPPRDTLVLETKVRHAAVELGLCEALTLSFVSDEALARVGAPAATVRLLNPLTEDRSVMRTSLLPGLLDAIARARRHGERNARLFTIGPLFLPGDANDRLPRECPTFAAAIAGARPTHLGKPEDIDVFDVKAIALSMLERVVRSDDVKVVAFEREAVPQRLHPRAAANVLVDGRPVATFGLLHPDVVESSDIAGSVGVVEIDLSAIRELTDKPRKYKPIPRLPASTRDIALVVHDDTPAGAVLQAIVEAGGDLVESVDIFDLFRGQGVPADHRSLAFHVVYRDPKSATDPDNAKTLTDEEVDRRHAQVVAVVGDRFGARLR